MLKKLLIIFLKVIPMILAGLAFGNTLFAYFEIDTEWMNYVGGTSLLTLTFLYLASYVFKFCEYHRMFLHYVVVCNIISAIDVYFGIPISDVEFFYATFIPSIYYNGNSIDTISKEDIGIILIVR